MPGVPLLARIGALLLSGIGLGHLFDGVRDIVGGRPAPVAAVNTARIAAICAGLGFVAGAVALRLLTRPSR